MVETGTGPAPRAAPDLHRGRLSCGARRNLPAQAIEMPLSFAPVADGFRLRPQGADVGHDPSPRFRQPMKEEGPSYSAWRARAIPKPNCPRTASSSLVTRKDGKSDVKGEEECISVDYGGQGIFKK